MKSVLKRVVKVEFTRYGEERSVEEERRVDGELGSAVDGYMFLPCYEPGDCGTADDEEEGGFADAARQRELLIDGKKKIIWGGD